MEARVLIIIPCYNEEESLPGLLREIRNTPSIAHCTVLAVNDCSTDRTLETARAAGCAVLNLPVNLGIGGAVQAGLRYALQQDYDFAVQMDGDGQHPPMELLKLLSYQEATKANVVVGSRYLERSDAFRSTAVRRAGIRYFYRLNRLFTGLRVYDSTSGYRLFDRRAIALAAAHYPDEYPEPESLILFAKAGLSVAETAVNMRSRQGGQSSIGNTASVYYMIKVSIAMFMSFLRYSNRKRYLWLASR